MEREQLVPACGVPVDMRTRGVSYVSMRGSIEGGGSLHVVVRWGQLRGVGWGGRQSCERARGRIDGEWGSVDTGKRGSISQWRHMCQQQARLAILATAPGAARNVQRQEQQSAQICKLCCP